MMHSSDGPGGPVEGVRRRSGLRLAALLGGLVVVMGFAGCESARRERMTSWFALRQALTFHASFDGRIDADFAEGDPRLYTAPALDRRAEAAPGLRTPEAVRPAEGRGRFGDALEFLQPSESVVFFRGGDNVGYRPGEWGGTFSFWLRVDPDGALPDGWVDPLQVTDSKWDDGAFFVEFTPDVPKRFRLGIYPDRDIWNPGGRPFSEFAESELPLAVPEKAPFSGGRWTHVAITFRGFNGGAPNASARLYLNGEYAASLAPRRQVFTWDPEGVVILLGIRYVGGFDELSFFNRPLSSDEVQTLYRLDDGVTGLMQ